MNLVLDASAALSFVLADEYTPASERALTAITREGGLVPSLWDYEVLNGLRSAEARGRLTPAGLAQAVAGLLALPLTRAVPGAADRLLHLSRETRLSVYDAAYLDLAIAHTAVLATRDEALARAAEDIGVPLLP